MWCYLQLFIEEICRDIYRSDSEWKIILLRYFNPVGAHPTGYIGENLRGIPNNLMPFVQQVAVDRRPALTLFGTDYSTKDGTGVYFLHSQQFVFRFLNLFFVFSFTGISYYTSKYAWQLAPKNKVIYRHGSQGKTWWAFRYTLSILMFHNFIIIFPKFKSTLP